MGLMASPIKRNSAMSGTNYLVDTNFLIYLLNGNEFIKPYLNNNFFLSEITEMELLGFFSEVSFRAAL